jgi:hypothetical protein
MTRPLVSPNSERILAFAGLTIAIAGLISLKFLNPASSSWLPQCPFHALTGLNCPGCGATRGMHALLNGDVLTALHFNVLLVIFVPFIIYGFIALLSLAFRGRSLPPPKYSAQFAWILFVILIVFGVVRNLPFYPFNLLAI